MNEAGKSRETYYEFVLWGITSYLQYEAAMFSLCPSFSLAHFSILVFPSFPDTRLVNSILIGPLPVIQLGPELEGHTRLQPFIPGSIHI